MFFQVFYSLISSYWEYCSHYMLPCDTYCFFSLDHRYFMETAFVYGKHYKFVVTTEKAMPGVKGCVITPFHECQLDAF